MASYSGQTPIKGKGMATAAQIDAWMQTMGKQLAPTYAPDHTYKQPPDIGLTIINLCAEVGINSDLVAAQICKESAGWQSAIVRAKNNPSGLGAVNDNAYAGAVTFDTPAAGIKATIAHLLTYVEGTANPWWSFDPRAAAVPSKNLGVVDVLSDLDGRWAVPGVGYGSGIAQLANQLVASGGGTNVATADDSAATWQPSSNFDAGRGGVTIDRIILHTTEGGYESALNWLRGAAAGSSNRDSSTTYLVSADGSRIAQLVRETDTSWAAGNLDFNQRGINIEQEGYADRGGFSDALYQATGALVGRVARRHGIPLDRAHVIGHMDVPDPNNPALKGGIDHHHDPGQFYDFDRVLAIAKDQSATPQQAPPAERVDPVTGFTIIGGIRAYIEVLEAQVGPEKTLMLIGRPLTNEYDTDYGKAQDFERQRLEWHKDARPQDFDILPGLVNKELLDAKAELAKLKANAA